MDLYVHGSELTKIIRDTLTVINVKKVKETNLIKLLGYKVAPGNGFLTFRSFLI